MGNAKKFDELLRFDEALQEKLKVAAEAYAGDAPDERPRHATTWARVTQLPEQ